MIGVRSPTCRTVVLWLAPKKGDEATNPEVLLPGFKPGIDEGNGRASGTTAAQVVECASSGVRFAWDLVPRTHAEFCDRTGGTSKKVLIPIGYVACGSGLGCGVEAFEAPFSRVTSSRCIA